MAANLAPISNLVGEAASLPGMRECLQWFTREKQWINDIHLQLCRVPAPTFLEQQRAEWIVGQFRNLGWSGDTVYGDARVIWAFFNNPTEFAVAVRSDGCGEPIRVVMELRHLRWQVRRIWLPNELLERVPAGT